MTEQCSTCFFSRLDAVTLTASGGGAVTTEIMRCCHAMPPIAIDPNSVFSRGWRHVNDIDWCGYWSTDGTAASVSAGQIALLGPTGATGSTGATGATGLAGPTGIGLDSACTVYRDRGQTTGTTPLIIRQVPIPLNPTTPTWVYCAILIGDSTFAFGSWMEVQTAFLHGSGGVAHTSAVDILAGSNITGSSVTADIVANVGNASADITLYGKASTTLNWSVRTLVDRG